MQWMILMVSQERWMSHLHRSNRAAALEAVKRMREPNLFPKDIGEHADEDPQTELNGE